MKRAVVCSETRRNSASRGLATLAAEANRSAACSPDQMFSGGDAVKKPTPVRIRRIIARLTLSLLVVASFLLGSCSSKQPEGNLNKSSGAAAPETASKTSVSSGETSFIVIGAWRPKKVLIKASSMEYTLTPKAHGGFIALEIALKQENRNEPVPANFSKVVLLDSRGGSHEPLLSYPSSLSSPAPNEDSISFHDEPGKLINGRLSELGGRLILVFETPTNSSGFKVKIGGASPLDVEVKR